MDWSVVDGSLVVRGVGEFKSGRVGFIVGITLVLDIGDVAVLIGRVGDDLGYGLMCFPMVDYFFSFNRCKKIEKIWRQLCSQKGISF